MRKDVGDKHQLSVFVAVKQPMAGMVPAGANIFEQPGSSIATSVIDRAIHGAASGEVDCFGACHRARMLCGPLARNDSSEIGQI